MEARGERTGARSREPSRRTLRTATVKTLRSGGVWWRARGNAALNHTLKPARTPQEGEKREKRQVLEEAAGRPAETPRRRSGEPLESTRNSHRRAAGTPGRRFALGSTKEHWKGDWKRSTLERSRSVEEMPPGRPLEGPWKAAGRPLEGRWKASGGPLEKKLGWKHEWTQE